jgi:hypothetical protein
MVFSQMPVFPNFLNRLHKTLILETKYRFHRSVRGEFFYCIRGISLVGHPSFFAPLQTDERKIRIHIHTLA